MRIGPTEIIIVLVIVMLVFGIGKLPELGKSMGEGLRSFKKAQDDVTSEVKKATAVIKEPGLDTPQPQINQAQETPTVARPPEEEE
ncbi:twin-arginine translocation protein, TatA/E family subunit [Dehalogenimonas lykanthroporepellens BL-DC-9]|jgi:sec-independent protein translocase protein TatA|nr:twin-arginine translocation protein, TatA/E family subunit [Dehalogenimonas lykanthroporepellens BL-DC-9]